MNTITTQKGRESVKICTAFPLRGHNPKNNNQEKQENRKRRRKKHWLQQKQREEQRKTRYACRQYVLQAATILKHSKGRNGGEYILIDNKKNKRKSKQTSGPTRTGCKKLKLKKKKGKR